MKNLITLSAGVCIAITVLGGCKDTITNNNGKSQIVFPDSNVSYRKHVQPLFNLSCAMSDCHSASTHETRGYDFESYNGFMFTPGIVYPGSPNQSKLNIRVEGNDLGPQMPSARNPLNTNQQKGLRKWVLEGAKNN